jgi:hypothetical protein
LPRYFAILIATLFRQAITTARPVLLPADAGAIDNGSSDQKLLFQQLLPANGARPVPMTYDGPAVRPRGQLVNPRVVRVMFAKKTPSSKRPQWDQQKSSGGP